MALTNYEKQKRWREKNRALYNLQQRNRRKNLGTAAEKAVDDNHVAQESSPATLPTRLSTIEELRELIKQPVGEPEKPVVKSLIYKDDYGRVISEKQFNEIQDRKAEAERKGYQIDEYSQ